MFGSSNLHFIIYIIIYTQLFLSTAILMSGKWDRIIVLIGISLLPNDAHHHFIYLLVICISLKKCLVDPLPIFNWVNCLFIVNVKEFFE